jgi:hypothetical protein
MHKGYKCFKVSSGRVYISRDVIFDEEIFPFTELHSNVGARLRVEINLLPNHLLPSSSDDPMGTNFTRDQTLQNNLTHVPNGENSGVSECHLQEIGEQEGNPANTEFELDPVSKPIVVSDTASESASRSAWQTTTVGDELAPGTELANQGSQSHPDAPQSTGNTQEAGTSAGATTDTHHTRIVSGGT